MMCMGGIGHAQGFFRIIKNQGGGNPSPKTPSPPPQTKVTIVGKNEIYNRENLVRPFLVHQVLGPKPPPPLPRPAEKKPWARIEHLFRQLWHWGLVMNIWCGGPDELHQSIRVLLHYTQFCIQRQVCHPRYGSWDHVPHHVWTDKSNPAATQRMRQMCGPSVVRSTPLSQLVVSARSIIVMNVLMPTLVGNKLFISQCMGNTQVEILHFTLCSTVWKVCSPLWLTWELF